MAPMVPGCGNGITGNADVQWFRIRVMDESGAQVGMRSCAAKPA